MRTSRILLLIALTAVLGCAHAVSSQSASVVIHADRSRGEINPLIFGHFTEETLTSWEGGVSSQLLVDRKFSIPETRDPHAPMMIGVGGPWRPVALAGNVTLVQDRTVYYSAPMSERITNYGGPAPAGVQQSGYRIVLPHVSKEGFLTDPFDFRAGQHYLARIAIKDKDLSGDIHVALGNSYREVIAEHVISLQPGSNWRVYEFELAPTADASDGKFMIFTTSRGTVWIDSASLVRRDLDDGGLRSDVLAATRKILPTNVRWPGGWFVSDYHWQNGLGPVDRRPAEINRAWGMYYNNDIGIDEYLRFCQKVGATPYIVVNVGSGTSEEAAALVEYVNGAATSSWGKRRTENGQVAPYGVKLWNVGNEEYLPTLGGTSSEGYVKNYLEFAKAMKAADPTIRLVAVGAPQIPRGAVPPTHPMFDVLRYIYNWNDTFLPPAGKETDLYSFHYYDPGDSIHGTATAEQVNYAAFTLAEHLSEKLDPIFQIMSRSGRHIPIALDEWSVKMPDKSPEGARPNVQPGVQAEKLGFEGNLLTLREALGEAAVYNLMQRRPSDFGLASRTLLYAYQLGLIGIARDKVALSPSALMLELFSTRDKTISLDCDVVSPTFNLSAIEGYSEVKDAKYLDVSARAVPSKHTLEVFVVNRDITESVASRVRIDGARLNGSIETTVLNAPDLNQWNSFEEPDRVKLRTAETKANSDGLDWTFEPHSLTKFEFSYQP
jgi:alpha-N-arabinofuranosidase